MLDLSRIEAGQIPLAPQAVDLREAVLQALTLMAPQAREQGVTLQPPPADGAFHVQADATRLAQVLVNLLSNAIKYNRPGGEVRIGFVTRDGLRGLCVADTGRGMTEQQLARLYSPFDRLGLESSPIPGTGIGLVITRRLVELMQGRLEVESQAGQGSRFTVLLPHAEPADASAGGPLAAGVPAQHEARGDVLYIEDNELNATLMREVFALRPGCRLRLCRSLEEGRALLQRHRPDVLLVDLHLPDGSGLELLRWMRATPQLQSLPAVVVSADATRAQQDEAMAAGATAYLTKPVRIDQALRLIDAMLTHRSTRP